VTEKLFEAWHYAAIPIAWGAPNVADYALAPHSLINALDFAGPAELAAYVLQVASNATLYNSYFDWRATGASRAFDRLREYAFTRGDHRSWLCRVCQVYEKRHCEPQPKTESE
jgi:hypothetical protein